LPMPIRSARPSLPNAVPPPQPGGAPPPPPLRAGTVATRRRRGAGRGGGGGGVRERGHVQRAPHGRHREARARSRRRGRLRAQRWRGGASGQSWRAGVRVLAACAGDEMVRAKLPCVWHCGMRIIAALARMMGRCACTASSCAGEPGRCGDAAADAQARRCERACMSMLTVRGLVQGSEPQRAHARRIGTGVRWRTC
jgi:hypothetical protein